jgi:hypothetical protein
MLSSGVQPALVAFDNLVKEKVALVCVMELASQRPPSNRSIAFGDIALATRLPLEQVCDVCVRVCACVCALPPPLTSRPLARATALSLTHTHPCVLRRPRCFVSTDSASPM